MPNIDSFGDSNIDSFGDNLIPNIDSNNIGMNSNGENVKIDSTVVKYDKNNSNEHICDSDYVKCDSNGKEVIRIKEIKSDSNGVMNKSYPKDVIMNKSDSNVLNKSDSNVKEVKSIKRVKSDSNEGIKSTKIPLKVQHLFNLIL